MNSNMNGLPLACEMNRIQGRPEDSSRNLQTGYPRALTELPAIQELVRLSQQYGVDRG